MSSAQHLFIHPWLNPDETWGGFQIAFTGGPAAYAAALDSLAASPALPSFDQRLTWSLPVPALDCLAGAAAFPGAQTVLLFTAGAPDAWTEAESGLRLDGRQLGLLLGPADRLPPAGTWNQVVLAASHARTLPPFSLMSLATRTRIALTGVRSRNEVAWAVANRCSLVSGEYLIQRGQPSKQPDMSRLRMLKLLALIVNDADTCEIEEIFRQEPKLAYGLLRLVNSAAMALRDPITSFSQAIALLGRKQLQRWLQLLVYADPNNEQRVNPLLLVAATRGRLLELLAGSAPPREPEGNADTAFMIGAFSLLDVLFDLPMQEVLSQLPLPDYAQAALAEQRGPLGRLLAALAAADQRELASAAQQLGELGIDCATYIDAQMEALAWANRIRQAM